MFSPFWIVVDISFPNCLLSNLSDGSKDDSVIPISNQFSFKIGTWFVSDHVNCQSYLASKYCQK